MTRWVGFSRVAIEIRPMTKNAKTGTEELKIRGFSIVFDWDAKEVLFDKMPKKQMDAICIYLIEEGFLDWQIDRIDYDNDMRY